MRNFRSLVLGLLLVSLSPLGWGEDVYYCVEEHRVELEPVFSDWSAAYEVKLRKKRKFTLKYEADANRLAIKGRDWAGDQFSTQPINGSGRPSEATTQRVYCVLI